MGADSWTYTVPFQHDITAALTALQLRELEETVTSPRWPAEWPRPATMEELWELMAEDGSFPGGILGLEARLIGPRGQDTDFAIRLLSAAELQTFFGTQQPTQEDFERADAASAAQDLHLTGPYRSPGPCPPGCPHDLWPTGRDQGRCTVLYDQTGTPTHIAVWGTSST